MADLGSLPKGNIFWGFGFLAFYIVLLILYRTRVFNFTPLASSDFYSMVLILAWVVIGLIMYVKAFRSLDFPKSKLKQLFIFSFLFNILLLPLLPLNSTDLYNYISRGRVLSIYSQNPYLVPYISFTQDEYYSILQTIWSQNTPVYGPIFTLISTFLSYLARGNIVITILIFKLFFSSLNVLNSFLVYRLTLSKKALFLYAWNPYIIIEFSLNGHNDVLMIFFILLSLLFIKYYKKPLTEVIGFAFIVASALVKLFGVLFLPFYFIHIVSLNKERVMKAKVIFFCIFVGLLVAFLTYLPFWEEPIFLRRLFELSNYSNIFASPVVLLTYSFLKIIRVQNYLFWGRIISQALFVLLYFFMLIRFSLAKKKSDFSHFLNTCSIVLSLFLLTALNWFMGWYVILWIVLIIIKFGDKIRIKYLYYFVGVSVYGLFQYSLVR